MVFYHNRSFNSTLVRLKRRSSSKLKLKFKINFHIKIHQKENILLCSTASPKILILNFILPLISVLSVSRTKAFAFTPSITLLKYKLYKQLCRTLHTVHSLLGLIQLRSLKFFLNTITQQIAYISYCRKLFFSIQWYAQFIVNQTGYRQCPLSIYFIIMVYFPINNGFPSLGVFCINLGNPFAVIF